MSDDLVRRLTREDITWHRDAADDSLMHAWALGRSLALRLPQPGSSEFALYDGDRLLTRLGRLPPCWRLAQ